MEAPLGSHAGGRGEVAMAWGEHGDRWERLSAMRVPYEHSLVLT